MKKKELTKKLALSKETLIRLDAPDLRDAVAAGWSDDSICPTTHTSKHCQ
jgi:hypothetical protein